MHELKSFHQLINNVFLVNLFQDVSPYDRMKICLCDGQSPIKADTGMQERVSAEGTWVCHTRGNILNFQYAL